TNTGGAASGTLSGGALAAGFGYTGGAFPGGGSCGPSLAPAASCTVGVSFAPASAGSASASMMVSYGGGTLAVPLKGLATTRALIVLSDAPAYDYGKHAVGSSTDH